MHAPAPHISTTPGDHDVNTRRCIDKRCLPNRHRLAQALLMAYGLAASGDRIAVQAQEVAAPAGAASAPASQQLESVVVTARKRDELLVDVPISIKSYSEKTLRASGAYDLQDLKTSSGFTLNPTAGATAGGRTLGNLTLRGLMGDSGFLPNETSGGLFLDGIYVSTAIGSLNTSDVARVEVLKGPQNAFFGRNTFGGAINFITKNPSDKFRGEVNTAVTGRGSIDTDGSLEGPLISNVLSGRITVVSRNKVAEYRASDGGELGAESTRSLAGTLYATPTDDLWLRLRGQYQLDDDSSAAIGYLPAVGNTSCAGAFFPGAAADGTPRPFTPQTGYFCGSIPSLDTVGSGVINANTNIPPGAAPAYLSNSLNDPVRAKTPDLNHSGMRREIRRAALQGGYALPYGADLAFNVGYNESNSTSIWDLDRSVSLNYFNLLALATRDLTLDARVSTDAKLAVRGLLGVSYFTQRYQFAQLNFDNYATATRDPNNYINNESKVPAAYGSIEYDILQNLTVSADVRYQSDKITTTSFTGAATFENTAKNWLPRVALRFKPDSNTTFYASYAKGVQQLASNVGYINATPTVKAYIASVVPGSSDYTPQPKLDSFELGVKQSLLENRVQYALAVYDQKWHNRLTQTTILCPVGQVNTPACPLTASGTSVAFGNEARIKGLEFSVDAAIDSQWSVGANLDYKHARWSSYFNSTFGGITGFTAPRIVRFDGNTLARVPEVQAAVNATFRTPLAAGWAGYARTDVAYTGRAWESDLNIVQTDPYFRVNLRVGIEKLGTTVEVFARNLFDDKHWDSAYRLSDLSGPFPGRFTQGMTVTPPPQREFGIRVRYAFE
jgi:iron complex outermembrane receptor protein